MDIKTIKPIALFRYNDFVLFFMDNPKGRMFLSSLSALPREEIGQMLGDILASANGDINYLNGDNLDTLGVIFCLMEKTSLPRDMPSMKIVGMDPSLCQEDTPRWDSSL